ncbi:uncharacterized protein LODBEIA_P55660 [Lodderomyces beijingensis]|uniref:Zn(2)-C6 fungal-type domain-containing protein n=1 Tax=Lodderomyces beijingensis TaxID=1775926 RepID=A0ABP0ZWD4_9ASCO
MYQPPSQGKLETNPYSSPASLEPSTNTPSADLTSTALIPQKQNQHKSQNKNKNFNIIIGPRARTKTGCLNCRKRKKKCDETSPTCQACQTRNQECIWPNLTSQRGASPKRRLSGQEQDQVAKRPARVISGLFGFDNHPIEPLLSNSNSKPKHGQLQKSHSELDVLKEMRHVGALYTVSSQSDLRSSIGVASEADYSRRKERHTVKNDHVHDVEQEDEEEEEEDYHDGCTMDDVGHYNLNVLLSKEGI